MVGFLVIYSPLRDVTNRNPFRDFLHCTVINVTVLYENMLIHNVNLHSLRHLVAGWHLQQQNKDQQKKDIDQLRWKQQFDGHLARHCLSSIFL